MQVLLLVPLLNKSGLIKRMRISQNRRIKHVLFVLYYIKYPANLLGFFYCTVCTICIYVVDKNAYSVRMVLLSSHPHPPHPHPHPKSSSSSSWSLFWTTTTTKGDKSIVTDSTSHFLFVLYNPYYSITKSLFLLSSFV